MVWIFQSHTSHFAKKDRHGGKVYGKVWASRPDPDSIPDSIKGPWYKCSLFELNLKSRIKPAYMVGSSVTSERLVSALSDVVSDKRSLLTDQHIAERVFMSRLDDKYWPEN
ncbi:hypothetical protein AVEN_164620-1 [Araneus ventricosus]|uniref:Uncharacterized protein n=1 Tax=Araneus ventricosus TaxID=182803 RepID=A0A4Y2P491_ARAVE|nr:hypothetical protein AVEN_164620-1 [Araneus ventricosus]